MYTYTRSIVLLKSLSPFIMVSDRYAWNENDEWGSVCLLLCIKITTLGSFLPRPVYLGKQQAAIFSATRMDYSTQMSHHVMCHPSHPVILH